MSEYIKNIKNPLYAVIMDVLVRVNPNEVMEVYKNMGKIELNEDNRGLPKNYENKIKSLSDDKIKAIGVDIFDIRKIGDLEKYF